VFDVFVLLERFGPVRINRCIAAGDAGAALQLLHVTATMEATCKECGREMPLALEVPDLGRFYLCHCGSAQVQKHPRHAQDEAARILGELRSYVLSWKKPPSKAG
jgi:hypothetical protein